MNRSAYKRTDISELTIILIYYLINNNFLKKALFLFSDNF